jgi:phosphoserine phosphatase
LNLVAQGPAMTAELAAELAQLAGPPAKRITSQAYRYRKASPSKEIASWCEAHHLDHAFVTEKRRFADLKLLAMDMDSTLITIECIDEMGDMAGQREAVAAVTAQAMRGEIDYAESLRRRVRLLKGLPLSALERVYAERLKLTAGAELLLERCKSAGIKLLLVSGGFTFFVDRLKDRLGFDYTASNKLALRGGKLTGELSGDLVGAEAKAAKFAAVAKELKAEREETVAIGDGANDLEMMKLAGVSVAYRAKPVVREQATCAFNWTGLDGVVNLFE